jgi:hypothetical protein
VQDDPRAAVVDSAVHFAYSRNWEVNFWQLTDTISRDKRYFRFADHASVIHKRAIFDPSKYNGAGF